MKLKSKTVAVRRPSKTNYPGLFHLDALEARRLLSGTSLIDVDFTVGTPVQSGAAVVGGTGDVWNGVSAPYFVTSTTRPSGSNIPLTYADGTASPVLLTYTAEAATHLVQGSPSFGQSAFANLANSYLIGDPTDISPSVNDTAPGSITLSGLAPGTTYRLTLISAGDTTGRMSQFHLADQTRTAIFDSAQTAFTSGVNYVQFTATTDATGQLTVSYDAPAGQEADLNGFQLQTVPAVTQQAPNLAANQSVITIAGTGFDPNVANDSVTFDDGAAGTVTSATPTSLTISFTTPPSPLHLLEASVTSDQISSGSPTVVAKVIQGVNGSTQSLPINATSLVIAGAGFEPTAAADSVTFNDGAVGTVASATANSLTVNLTAPPAAVGNLTAVVTEDGVSSGAPVQVATVAPLVTASTANWSATQGTLAVDGAGFDPNSANDAVSFNNGAVGMVTSASATELTITLTTEPAQAGVLTATVASDGISSGGPVQVATVVGPTVTASSADLPIAAASIVIAGTGFDPTLAANSVTFSDGAVGAVTAASANSLTVSFTTNPSANGSLTAIVSTDGLSSGAPVKVANVVPTPVNPTVSANTATLAITDKSLVINGTGFDANTANDAITLYDNGVQGPAATIQSATGNSLTITFTAAPPGVGTLAAVVTSDGLSSSTPVQVATVVPAPVNPIVAPGTARVTTSVLISGANFDPNTANDAVTFTDNGTAGPAGKIQSATATTLAVVFSSAPTIPGSLTAVVTSDGLTSGAPVQVATVVPAVGTSQTLPVGTFSATTPITAGSTTKEQITVVYSDANNVTFSSINSSNLLVTGPDGSTLAVDPKVVTDDATALPAPTITATYTVDAPSAGWAAGTYAVTLNASQIGDSAGQTNAAVVSSFVPTIVPLAHGTLAVNVTTNIPKSAIAGTKSAAVATVTVTNPAGSSSTYSGSVTISLYVSPAQSVAGAVKAGAAITRKLRLKPGASKSFSIPLNSIPTVSAGDYYVVASVNASGASSPRSDAASTTTFHIGQAVHAAVLSNLQIVPGIVASGKHVTLTFALADAGNVPLSGTATITVATAASKKIATVKIPGYVAVGATRNFKARFVVPRSLTTGVYTLTESVAGLGLPSPVSATLAGTLTVM